MVWDAIIAIYLFLAGLGAGAFALGALTNWAKTPAPTMKKVAFIVAPVAVAVGTLMLVVDAHAGLMNPLRFFGLVANLGSGLGRHHPVGVPRREHRRRHHPAGEEELA